MTTVVHVSEPHDVCVMRPGKWGNPFRVGVHGTRRQVVEKHKEWLPQQKGLMADLEELRGKRIACCCHGQPCHAYTLAEFADAQPQSVVVRTGDALTVLQQRNDGTSLP